MSVDTNFSTRFLIPYYLDGSDTDEATEEDIATTIDNGIGLQSDDLDQIYADVYTASGRNHNGLPALSEPLQTTLAQKIKDQSVENLMVNSDFKDSFTAWTQVASGSCTVTKETALTDYPVGYQSAELVSDNTYQAKVWQDLMVDASNPQLRIGYPVSISCYTKPPTTAGDAKLQVDMVQAGGNVILTQTTNSTGVNQTWERMEVDNFIIPSNTERIRVFGLVITGTKTGYFTGFQLERGKGITGWKESYDKRVRIIGTNIDGAGSAISTGIKSDIPIEFTCTVLEWTLLADQSGSIQVDLWQDSWDNYAPTNADSITGSSPPSISTATKNKSSTLTGWTTTLTQGNTLRVNVDSCTSITRCAVVLKVLTR